MNTHVRSCVCTGNPLTGTLANIVDPDDNAAFHQGQHCLLSQNQSSQKEIYFWGNYNLYTMDHPDLTVSNLMGNSFGTKIVNLPHGHKKAGLISPMQMVRLS